MAVNVTDEQFEVKVSSGGLTLPTTEHIGWQSPRLRQAMMQTGTTADELHPRPIERFVEDAKKRAEQMGWKSSHVLNEAAERRFRTAELQRRKVILMVIDVRQGMVDKNMAVSPLIDPKELQKASNVKGAAEMKETLRKDNEKRERALVTEQQRAAAQLERLEDELRLQTDKQKEMARLNAIQAEKERHKARQRKRRQEKALEWQLEVERLREADREENRQVAQARELDQEKRDANLKKLIAAREQAAQDKARQFAEKQERRGQKIRQQNQDRADAAWRKKLDDEKTASRIEIERERKRSEDKAARKAESDRQAARLAERLSAKRQQDKLDHENLLRRAEEREAAVKQQMAAREKELRRRKKQKEKEWAAKEAARKTFYEGREQARAESIHRIEEREESKQATLRENKQKLDAENALRTEHNVIKFEETRRNIERLNRAWDFESDRQRMEQVVKNERSAAMLAAKTKLAEKRRYEAGQFLLNQSQVREELATKARQRQTEVAGKMAILAAEAAGEKPPRVGHISAEKLDSTLSRLSSPQRRQVGGGTPRAPTPVGLARAAKEASGEWEANFQEKLGRESPLPIWTWCVDSSGSPQPRF